MLLKLVCEETDEPVEAEEHGIKHELLELVRDDPQFARDQLLKDLDVNLDTQELCVVVNREHSLEKMGEDPEGFGLCLRELEDARENEVHALTVSNQGVALRVGTEHSSHEGHDWRLLEVADVEARDYIVREGTVEVELHLMEVRVRIALKGCEQRMVVMLKLGVVEREIGS